MPAPLALHVVIATDGSKEANETIREARILLDPTTIDAFTVVTVINPMRAIGPYAEISPDVWDELERAMHQVAADALAGAHTRLEGIAAKIDAETLMVRTAPF